MPPGFKPYPFGNCGIRTRTKEDALELLESFRLKTSFPRERVSLPGDADYNDAPFELGIIETPNPKKPNEYPSV